VEVEVEVEVGRGERRRSDVSCGGCESREGVISDVREARAVRWSQGGDGDGERGGKVFFDFVEDDEYEGFDLDVRIYCCNCCFACNNS
jgi:hypothetical protein